MKRNPKNVSVNDLAKWKEYKHKPSEASPCLWHAVSVPCWWVTREYDDRKQIASYGGDTPEEAVQKWLDDVDPLPEPELPTPIEAIRGYLDWITNKIAAADYTESYGYYTFTDLFKAVVAAEKSHSKELSEAEKIVLSLDKFFSASCYYNGSIKGIIEHLIHDAGVCHIDSRGEGMRGIIKTIADRIRAKKGNKS